MGQVTVLLAQLTEGRHEAFDALYGLLYPELRRLARARIRQSGPLTLIDTTALVHEAYLRLEQQQALAFDDRAKFLAYAARVMRSIVVDAVRARLAERRGGGAEHVQLDETAHNAAGIRQGTELLQVHESLHALEAIDARLVRVVEMRYFAGMTEPEVAQVLGVGLRTVARDWEKARLFLRESLRGAAG